jgi:hypothetical protein
MNSNINISGTSEAAEIQYLTVQQVAVTFNFSSKYIREKVSRMLQAGMLTPGVDVLAAESARRRRYRIHRETGLAKIQANLKPKIVN